MSIQKYNSSLEFIKKTSTDELFRNHLQLVFDTYYNIFGEVCTGCPNKIAGYILRLKKHNKTNIMSKSKDTREFRLKTGTILPVPGTSKAYTDVNITDEIALKLLKENPNRKALFLKLPKNIDELIGNEEESNEVDKVVINEVEYSIEEAKEILLKAGVETKATTVKGVQKKVDESIEAGVEFETE